MNKTKKTVHIQPLNGKVPVQVDISKSANDTLKIFSVQKSLTKTEIIEAILEKVSANQALLNQLIK